VRGYPTLLVLDARGNELGRQLGAPEKLTEWIGATAGRARLTESELEAQLALHPDDAPLLWLAVARAKARGAGDQVKKALGRIEAADRGKDRADAAKAGWMRAQRELEDGVQKRVVEVTQAYVDRYPAHALEAAGALAAAGADPKLVAAAFLKVAQAAPPGELNTITYAALGAGALDAALEAARRQVAAQPKDPNGYDTLAEVHNYRGERDKALEMEKRGMAMPNLPADLKAAMEANLERFARGGRDPAVRPPGLGNLLSGLGPQGGGARVISPVEIAKHYIDRDFPTLGAPCGKHAKGMSEAYVRITIGKSARPEKAEVLEPGASAALRKCLEKAMMAIPIPADSPAARLVMPIKLPSK
jgi:hypothetical protein